WITPTTGSSDLFNCCGNCAYFDTPVCVPYNFDGYQQPHSGNGYAGIHVYNDNQYNYREYVQTSLQTPLIAGETYWVSFYVSLVDNYDFAVNNIGAYLSETPISSGVNQNFNCCSPQVNTSEIINSSTEWTLISGCFTALGNEQFITIGNFNNNENITAIDNPASNSASYVNIYVF